MKRKEAIKILRAQIKVLDSGLEEARIKDKEIKEQQIKKEEELREGFAISSSGSCFYSQVFDVGSNERQINEAIMAIEAAINYMKHIRTLTAERKYYKLLAEMYKNDCY